MANRANVPAGSAHGGVPACRMKTFTAFLTVVAVISLLSGCGKSKQEAPPWNDYGSAREEVIRRVQKGEIKPDESAAVVLPPDVRGASADGKIYISNDPTSGWLIVFNLANAQPNTIQGLLHAERSLTPKSGKIRAGPVELFLDRRIDDHWYQVSYRPN